MTPVLLFLGLLLLATAVSALGAAVLGWCRRADCAVPPRDFAPPVSIVKPLAGLDDELEENLESFFRLDYPSYEVIFSFARREDPAFEVARRVADRHPEIPAVFVVDPSDLAPNPKINRLTAGVRRARHRHLLFSDGNVRVVPSFLRRVIAPFRDSRVGLVSNLFRGSWPRTLSSRLECLYLNGTLQPGTALLGRLLRRPCVVGKSILVSREALESIGEFRPVRDYLAEDYLLGVEVRRAGYRVVLSAHVLDTAEISRSPAAAWARHRRWAIMRKRLAGPAYAAELLANPLPWVVGAVASSDGHAGPLVAALALIIVRYSTEVVAERDGGHTIPPRDFPLLPVRDLLALALFFAGLFGTATRWRGRRMFVGPRTRISTGATGSREGFLPTPRRAV